MVKWIQAANQGIYMCIVTITECIKMHTSIAIYAPGTEKFIISMYVATYVRTKLIPAMAS